MYNMKKQSFFGLWSLRAAGLLLIAASYVMNVDAQPKKSRSAQQEKTTSSSSIVTERQKLQFPASVSMPDNVVWRRDIYRTLDLNKDENAGLYYPVTPSGKEMNLFTFIFRLVLTGNLQVYQYKLDGNESFNASDKVNIKEILDNYGIFYEEKNNRLVVDNSDIPSAEVQRYYIKECSYYDQNTSTFATKVIALCPVMLRQEDFGDPSLGEMVNATPYPLFWVKFSELEPFLNRLTLMTSNLNNAATMSGADYFTLHKYKGTIYKTTNMLGKTLSQYCPTDSAMRKEQARIEAELVAFEKTIYGDKAKRDSLDSIANAKPEKAKKVKKSSSRRGGESADNEEAKVTKSSKKQKSSSSAAPKISVRRERH